MITFSVTAALALILTLLEEAVTMALWGAAPSYAWLAASFVISFFVVLAILNRGVKVDHEDLPADLEVQ